MDEATRKLFAIVSKLERKLSKLDELEKRLTALDTNGKFEEIKRVMAQVEANSRVGVNTVESHGSMIMRMEKLLTRLELRCPELKPTTGEFQKVSEATERKKLKDE